MNKEDIVFRLQERARIRRQIPSRKSVQENKPDRIADLLEEAAHTIIELRDILPNYLDDTYDEKRIVASLQNFSEAIQGTVTIVKMP